MRRALGLAFLALVSIATTAELPEIQTAKPVFEAITAGDKVKVAGLLDTLKDTEIRNDYGYTFLHWAVLVKRDEIVSFLISRGAGIEAALPNGYTPLHTAASSGSIRLVKILIDGGADLYAAEQRGKHPLDLAVEFGHPELIPLLKPIHRAVEEGSLDQLRTLIRRFPGSLDERDETGASPLHLAAQRGALEIIELLAGHGADLQARGPWGKTPLRLALDHDRRAAAEYLRGRGARDQSDDGLLREKLREGEAIIWHLFNTGWAVKTKSHFLIFDFVPREDSVLSPFVAPCLASGEINPRQIRDQKVVVFAPIIWGEAHLKTLLSWKKDIKDLTFIIGERKFADPAAVYIEPRFRKMLNGMEILPIRTTGFGEGFVVTVDGLTLFHGGDHESNEQSRDLFAREIDFVGEHVPKVDILFLQMVFEEQSRSSVGVFHALEKLMPAVMFPTTAIAATGFYRRFLQEAAKKGFATKIQSAKNRGDLFFFPDRF